MNSQPLLYSAVLALLGVGFLIYPHLARPGLFFAVTVSRGFSSTAEGQRIVRRFRVRVSVTVISATMAILAFEVVGEPPNWAFLLVGGLEYGGLLCIFLFARHEVLLHAIAAETIRQASLTPWPRVFRGGPVVAMTPLLLVGVTVVSTVLQWDQLPTRVPTHWTFSGPDQWIQRTPLPMARFLLLRFSAVSLLLTALPGTARLIGRTVGSAESARTEAYFRRIYVFLLVLTSYLVAIQAPTALFLARHAWTPSLMTIGSGMRRCNDIQQVLGHASVSTTEKHHAQFSPEHSSRRVLRALQGGADTKRIHQPEDEDAQEGQEAVND